MEDSLDHNPLDWNQFSVREWISRLAAVAEQKPFANFLELAELTRANREMHSDAVDRESVNGDAMRAKLCRTVKIKISNAEIIEGGNWTPDRRKAM